MSARRTRAIAIAAALLVGLSGCVRMTTDITLHQDNTASGEILVAVEEGAGEQDGMSDAEVVAALGEGGGASSLVNSTVSPYKEDGYVGNRITFSDEPIASFSGLDVNLERDGDTFVFKAKDAQYTEMPPPDSGAIVTMSVTFPGRVTKHNGTLEGTTVTWDLLTQADAPYATGSAIEGGGGDGGNANATASNGVEGFRIAAMVIGGLLIAAMVIGGVILLRRRGGASPADEAPPTVESTSS